VQALTLAKISRIISSKNEKPIQNVLEDPEALLSFLVQESTRCSNFDKETVVQILFSIADRYLEESDYVEKKPIQAILRAGARISQTFADSNLSRIKTVHALEGITKTKLTWLDVSAFAAGDSLIPGVHFTIGQKISCKVRCQVMNGYAVILLGNENLSGILETKQKFEIGTWLDAYFVRTEKNRAWLTLTPPNSSGSCCSASSHSESPVNVVPFTTDDGSWQKERATALDQKFEVGKRVVCSISRAVPGGYRVFIQQGTLAYLSTDANFKINDQRVAVIEKVNGVRLLLHLPDGEESSGASTRLTLHILLAELGRLQVR
jgi:hypothetical protein